MKSRNAALVTAALVLGGLFFWYGWPGAYIYSFNAQNPAQVYRTNRFTGVKTVATDNGWKTEAELEAEFIAKARANQAGYEADMRRQNGQGYVYAK